MLSIITNSNSIFVFTICYVILFRKRCYSSGSCLVHDNNYHSANTYDSFVTTNNYPDLTTATAATHNIYNRNYNYYVPTQFPGYINAMKNKVESRKKLIAEKNRMSASEEDLIPKDFPKVPDVAGGGEPSKMTEGEKQKQRLEQGIKKEETEEKKQPAVTSPPAVTSAPISESKSESSSSDSSTSTSSFSESSDAIPNIPKCQSFQNRIYYNSWDSLSKSEQSEWTDKLKCEDILPLLLPSKRTKIPPKDGSQDIKRCMLVANGPSLRKQKWTGMKHMDYIIGLNKIFKASNKFSLALNALVIVNNYVADQAVEGVFGHLPKLETKKYITAVKAKSYIKWYNETQVAQNPNVPLTKNDNQVKALLKDQHGISFVRSVGTVFIENPSESLTINQGWTVTYAALQILYEQKCSRVYIVGMDHNFQQSGPADQAQKMKGEDPNHFDPSYFQNHTWQLANLPMSEQYYKIGYKRYQQAGRRIIDATIGGKCRIFEKEESLDSVLKKEGLEIGQ